MVSGTAEFTECTIIPAHAQTDRQTDSNEYEMCVAGDAAESTVAPCCFDHHLQISEKKKRKKICLSNMELGERACCSQGGLTLRRWRE